jgi:hypothetical protein
MQDLLRVLLTMLAYFVVCALIIGGGEAGSALVRRLRRRAARPRQVSLVKAWIKQLPDEGGPNRYAKHIVVENASPYAVSDVHVIRTVGYLTSRVRIDWREPVLGPGSQVARKFDFLEHLPGLWSFHEVTVSFIDADGRRWRRTGSRDPRRYRLALFHAMITAMTTRKGHAA